MVGRRARDWSPQGAGSLGFNASRLVNLQGVRMGRPGRIYISLSSRAGVLEEVRVGGEAVVVGAGTVLD
jgi:predicted PhzF superfamily epimerase YddE/YHI9